MPYDPGFAEDEYWFTGGTGATLQPPYDMPPVPAATMPQPDWYMQPGSAYTPDMIDAMALMLSDQQFYAQLGFSKQQWQEQRLLEMYEMGGYMPTAGYEGGIYPGSEPGGGLAQGWMPTLQRELGTGQLGLGYLNLLGSLSGPANWLQYANVMRNAGGTQLPAWAAALSQGMALPQYQAPGATPPASLAQLGPGGLLNQGQGQEGMPSWAPPAPYQITPQQWQGLMPSEQAMLQGSVEYGGGFWPDYLSQMQAAWPTAQGATPVSFWG